ncbi:MAG: DinB family protein, partial [Calditrichia bacterium]
FDSSCKKVIRLADAIPSEYYNWRPTEKIRSIKESLMHVAGTHYFLASILNSPVPEGIKPGEFTKSGTTKKATQNILLTSIEHIRAAIQKIDNEQLYTTVDFFGGKETMQRVILQVGEHMAEHLGQLIVYARMQGVTPPWSK